MASVNSSDLVSQQPDSNNNQNEKVKSGSGWFSHVKITKRKPHTWRRLITESDYFSDASVKYLTGIAGSHLYMPPGFEIKDCWLPDLNSLPSDTFAGVTTMNHELWKAKTVDPKPALEVPANQDDSQSNVIF